MKGKDSYDITAKLNNLKESALRDQKPSALIGNNYPYQQGNQFPIQPLTLNNLTINRFQPFTRTDAFT